MRYAEFPDIRQDLLDALILAHIKPFDQADHCFACVLFFVVLACAVFGFILQRARSRRVTPGMVLGLLMMPAILLMVRLCHTVNPRFSNSLLAVST